MGDGPGSSDSEKSASVYQSLLKYMPTVVSLMGKLQPQVAQNELKTSQLVSPGYAELNQGLYDKYGRQQSKTTNEIDRATQLAGQETTKQLMAHGAGMPENALALERAGDPNAFGVQDATAAGIQKLLGSIDPTKLSGSERAEVERSNGRQFGFTPNAQNTTANAMTFGHELANKQTRFSDTLTKAAAAVPSLHSGISGFNVATSGSRMPTQVNTGTTSAVQNAGQNAWNLGNNQLSSAWGYNQRPGSSTLNDVSQGIGIGGSALTALAVLAK